MKLAYVVLLSSFAFKVNLRRLNKAAREAPRAAGDFVDIDEEEEEAAAAASAAGGKKAETYTRPLFGST